jgi:hypothetical protein
MECRDELSLSKGPLRFARPDRRPRRALNQCSSLPLHVAGVFVRDMQG